MNKISIFALTAVCIAVAYAIPAPRAVDWRAARVKVDEIQAAVTNGTDQIKTVANSDNPEVGNNVTLKVNDAARVIRGNIREAEYLILKEALTYGLAQSIMQAVMLNLDTLRNDLQDDLVKLSEPAADEIIVLLRVTIDTVFYKTG